MKPTPSKGKRQEPQRTRNSTRIFYLALAVIAVAGIGALSWMSRRPVARDASPFDSTLPKVQSNGYVIGSASAPIEVIEFGDFECPQCARFGSLTEPDVRTRLVDKGVIRFRFVDFPLSMHRNTWQASRAAACADEQGKFWAMHDALFQAQDQWNGEATSNPDEVFKGLAKQIGVNSQQFDQCIDTKRTQAKVQAHHELAMQSHINATPSFIIGGKVAEGAITYDEFKALVDAALAKSGSPLATPADSNRKTGATKATATKR
ncbi:MAG TPA: DsbA family protein [Gemmatimonadaceae bacterium]|nr:DsbA family protein [Gemmatimonadaceae bacterium]